MVKQTLTIEQSLPPALCKALSDPQRATLFAFLARCCRPCNVTELANCCPLDISVVSRHLKQLREAGMISSYKQGKEVYYSVCADVVIQALRHFADTLERCCRRNPRVTTAQSPKEDPQ